MHVEQFLSVLLPRGDGISDCARSIRDYVLRLGHTCEIIVRYPMAETASETRPSTTFHPTDNAIRLLHYSDAAWIDFVVEHRLPIRLLYHNVTPAHFLIGFDDDTYIVRRDGRMRLPQLIPFAENAFANSRYSECELIQLGFPHTGTFLLDVAGRFDRIEPDVELMRTLAGQRFLLFVGRFAPNKRQDDLIKLMWYYRQLDPSCKLYLVGHAPDGAYVRQVRRLVREFDLEQQVYFVGHVSQSELAAYYRSASVYVSMSEHEGFGLPLVESMLHDLPVVAYASTAVSEVVQGAGVLMRHKRFIEWALVIERVIHNEVLRRQVIEAQRARAREYSIERWNETLQRVLAPQFVEGDD